jgi:N-acetyltransferase 10
MDEELNVLPISFGKNILPTQSPTPSTELDSLKKTMAQVLPIGSLIKECKTIDQANALLTLVDSLNEKVIKTTCSVIAPRGRGKSATLGLAIASAAGSGYANIFLTSPSPENLKTLFEFILKGLEILGYQLHLDYDIVQEKSKAITRINLFRDHRQTIQYILPSDYMMLSQAELVVIDEAAAIPLPLVQNLLGDYVVFMASTVNGYEGTGRSLSLKLLNQLRETQSSTKKLREINLEYPIRYTPNDPVEKWLNGVLCLDVNTHRMQGGTPHPSACDLYVVNRDTLFSYHPVSESFLQRMMNLYVASHYKNSPNDLMLMSDAPQHGLFVLLGEKIDGVLPNPIVVVQVCVEGKVSRKSSVDALARGIRQSGDMIPWVISQQYQDDDFGRLSGVRVVRIATHPDYTGMGYGKRAMELVYEYYSGKSGQEIKKKEEVDVVMEVEKVLLLR